MHVKDYMYVVYVYSTQHPGLWYSSPCAYS